MLNSCEFWCDKWCILCISRSMCVGTIMESKFGILECCCMRNIEFCILVCDDGYHLWWWADCHRVGVDDKSRPPDECPPRPSGRDDRRLPSFRPPASDRRQWYSNTPTQIGWRHIPFVFQTVNDWRVNPKGATNVIVVTVKPSSLAYTSFCY